MFNKDKDQHKIVFERSEVLALQLAVVDQLNFFADVPLMLAKESDDQQELIQSLEQAESLFDGYKAVLHKLDIDGVGVVGHWETARALEMRNKFVEDEVTNVVNLEERKEKKRKEKKEKK